MSIQFEVNQDESCYLAKWEGRLTDADLLSAYKAFFDSEDWVPGHNSLVDLSELDAADITPAGLQSLAGLVRSRFAPHNIHPRIAVYAPHDLPYGLARMYSVRVEAFESHAAFRDRDEAIEWLRTGKEVE